MKEILLIVALNEYHLLCNFKLSISTNDKIFPTDSKLILTKEFMHTTNFIKVLKEKLIVKDSRLYYEHNNYLSKLIVGCKADYSADILSKI